MMQAHLMQLDLVWEDKDANFQKVRDRIGRAGVQRGDLVVLPEMFDTGFSFRLEVTADADGRTLAFLRELARELGSTVHGGRTIIGSDGRGRNLATIVGPRGDVLAEYAKIHPFSYGRESERFTGGEQVVTYSISGEAGEEALRACPAVCYDLRFPELFRRGLRMGAEAFVLGANWPAVRAGHWRALLIARAIENQAFVAGVNRCGHDPHLEYAGGTIAVGAKGDVLGELGSEEGVLTVPLDVEAVRSWRAEFPAWRDVRLG